MVLNIHILFLIRNLILLINIFILKAWLYKEVEVSPSWWSPRGLGVDAVRRQFMNFEQLATPSRRWKRVWHLPLTGCKWVPCLSTDILLHTYKVHFVHWAPVPPLQLICRWRSIKFKGVQRSCSTFGARSKHITKLTTNTIWGSTLAKQAYHYLCQPSKNLSRIFDLLLCLTTLKLL